MKKRKKQLIELYSANEKQYQEELREKYNPDNLFKINTIIKNEEQLQENDTDKMLVVIKRENIFTKIINKVKKYFIK